MATPKEFFAWQDDYGVDIQLLDTQHKELVGLLNGLFVAAFERKANKIIVDRLHALQRHCRMHFELEERLLQQMVHKDVAVHRNDNSRLLEQLDLLCRRHEREDMPVYFDMLYFLKHWLADHFRIVDSGDLLMVGLSSAAWEQSANEAFAGVRKAA